MPSARVSYGPGYGVVRPVQWGVPVAPRTYDPTTGPTQPFAKFPVAIGGAIQNSFEGGTNGSSVASSPAAPGDTAFDSWGIAAGATVAYDNAHVKRGSLAVKTNTRATAGTAFFGWADAALGGLLGDTYGRTYLYLTAFPTSSPGPLINFAKDAAGTSIASIKLLTTGKLQLVGSSDAGFPLLANGVGTLPLNQWFRLEWKIVHDPVNGYLVVRVYTTNPDSSVGNYDEEILGGPGGVDAAMEIRVFFGQVTNLANWPTATDSVWWDDVAHGAGNWFGPSSVPIFSISDTGASISDSITRNVTRAFSDTGASVSDSIASFPVRVRALTDTGTTSSSTVAVKAGRVLADTGAAVSDQLDDARTRALSDTGASVSESLATLRLRALTDTGATVSESLATRRIRPLADTGASVSETLGSARTRVFADTGAAVSDTVARVIARTLADTGATVTDSVASGRTRALSDTGASVSDTTPARKVLRVVSDTGSSVSDAVSRNFSRTTSDTGATISDSIVRSYARGVAATDTGASISDSITRAVGRKVSDTGTTSSSSVAMSTTRALRDYGLSSLSTSGNEITDLIRRLAYQLTPGMSTDGRGYTAVTNIFPYGGFEARLAPWAQSGGNAVTVVKDDAEAKFGGSSLRADFAGTLQYGVKADPGATFPLAASMPYTFSAWVKANVAGSFALQLSTYTSGVVFLTNYSEPAESYATSQGWIRISVTFIADATAAGFIPRVFFTPSAGPGSFWVDGVQVESGYVPHPYVDTNGVAATAMQPVTAVNLIPNSGLTSRGTPWQQWFSSGATSRITTDAPPGAVAAISQVAAGANNYIGVFQTDFITVPGVPYIGSIYVKVQTSGNYTLWIQDPAGNYNAAGGQVALTAGVWTRVSLPFTPTIASTVAFRLNKVTGTFSGETILWGAAMIELGSTLHDYVDNDYGDGALVLQNGDSSYGVWDATTNRVANGNLSTNATGYVNAGGTLTRDVLSSVFGGTSANIVFDGTSADQAVLYQYIAAGAAAEKWTSSCWVWAKSQADVGKTVEVIVSAVDATTHLYQIGAFTRVPVVLSLTPQRVAATLTTQATYEQLRWEIRTGSGVSQAVNLNVGGVQLEQKAIATPYVHTDGAARTRAAGRIRIPNPGVSAGFGWIAIRARMPYASTGALPNANPGWFFYGDQNFSQRIAAYTQGGTTPVLFFRQNATPAGPVIGENAGWNAGDAVWLVFEWDPDALREFLNHSTFTGGLQGATPLPTITSQTIDLGSLGALGVPLNAELLTAVIGNGALGASDVAALLALTQEPSIADFAPSADVLAIVPFDTDGYIENDDLGVNSVRPLSDTGASISDSPVRKVARLLADTGASVNDIMVPGETRILLDTGATITESIARLAVHPRTPSDTGASVTETIARVVQRPLADTGAAVSDSIAVTPRRFASDTGASVSDALASTRVRAVSDTGASVSDSLVRAVKRVLSDTGASVSDSLASTRKRFVTDTGASVSETVALARARFITDTGASVSDSLARSSARSATDTGASVSDSAPVVRVTRLLADTGAAISDTAAAGKLQSRTLTDNGVAPAGAAVGGLLESNEGGTNGQTVTAADPVVSGETAYDHVSIGAAGTVVYDNTHVHGGSLAVKVGMGAAGGNADFGWVAAYGTPAGDTFARFYLYLDALPSASRSFLYYVDSGGAILGSVGIDASGHIIVRSSTGTVIVTGTAVAALNQWIRLEARRVHGAIGVGANTLRLYNSPEAPIGSFDDEIVTSGSSVGVEAGALLGPINTTSWPSSGHFAWYDDIVVDATDWPGPVAVSDTLVRSNLTRALADTGAAVTDSLVRNVATRTRTIADTGASVSESPRIAVSRFLADTGASISDVARASIVLKLTDTGASVSDSITRRPTRAPADTGASISDAVTKKVSRFLTDTGATITEFAAASIVYKLTDTGASISETLKRANVTRAPSDTGAAVSDSLATKRLHVLADTGAAVTDSVASLRKRFAADTGATVSETTPRRNVVRPLTDTGAVLTDQLVTPKLVYATDTGASVSDVIATRVAPVLADTGAQVSDAGFVRALKRVLSDTGASISSSVAVRPARKLADTGATISESVRPRIVRTLADTGAAVSDSIARTSRIGRAVADVGASVSDATALRKVGRRITDTGASVSDTYATRTTRALSDVGALVSDAISARRIRVVSDTGAAISDSLVRSSVHVRAVSDVGAAVSDAHQRIAVARFFSDVGATIADVAADIRVRQVVDVGAQITDSVAKSRRVSWALADTGASISDTAAWRPIRLIVDTGATVSETLKPRVTRRLTDVGAAISDTTRVAVPRRLTDTGASVSDHTLPIIRHALADVGAAISDFVRPLIARRLADVGATITDLVRPLVARRLTDIGSAVSDTVAAKASRKLVDTGATVSDQMSARRDRRLADIGAAISDQLGRKVKLVLLDTGAAISSALAAKPSRRLADTGATISDQIGPGYLTPISIADTGASVADLLSRFRQIEKAFSDVGVTITDTIIAVGDQELTDPLTVELVSSASFAELASDGITSLTLDPSSVASAAVLASDGASTIELVESPSRVTV